MCTPAGGFLLACFACMFDTIYLWIISYCILANGIAQLVGSLPILLYVINEFSDYMYEVHDYKIWL